jgi:hypothetical protein
MKTYRVGYLIKMNSTQYRYSYEIEAANAKEAKDKVKCAVFKETGRNAFNPFIVKEGEDKGIEGMPPRKVQ